MLIGLRIKQRRVELGMSQNDLAVKLGYKDRSTLSYIEKNGDTLSMSKLVEIAEILHVTPQWLMGWDDEDASTTLTSSEQKLLELNAQLNGEGREKLTDYASDLVASGRYIKDYQPGMVEEGA